MIALLQILIVLLVQLQELAQYVASTTTSQRMTLAFRYRLFRRSQRLSLAFHDSRGTMDSIYRIQWDAPALQYVTIEGLVPLISALVMLVAMVVAIVRIDWELGLVALVVSPLLFFYGSAYNRRMRRHYVTAADR